MPENANPRVENVEGTLGGGTRQAEQAARRFKDTVVDKTHEGLEVSRSYIRENPLTTVLVAAGVGVLVGFLIARRN
jgi:ElaB/YqjD/DUF883 family membrane-anchored ribosome-binding protein